MNHLIRARLGQPTECRVSILVHLLTTTESFDVGSPPPNTSVNRTLLRGSLKPFQCQAPAQQNWWKQLFETFIRLLFNSARLLLLRLIRDNLSWIKQPQRHSLSSHSSLPMVPHPNFLLCLSLHGNRGCLPRISTLFPLLGNRGCQQSPLRLNFPKHPLFLFLHIRCRICHLFLPTPCVYVQQHTLTVIAFPCPRFASLTRKLPANRTYLVFKTPSLGPTFSSLLLFLSLLLFFHIPMASPLM